MGLITLSIFAAICFVGATYGTKCSAGPGYRFPITCPGLLNSTKSFCCEDGGSFHCCDKEEFASQEEHNNHTKPLTFRQKRDFWSAGRFEATTAVGLGTGATVAIVLGSLFPVILCCLCCCCCACCPCYHWCHPHSSNVTIVQPSGGGGASSNVQNNFCLAMPTQPSMPQQTANIRADQLPPQYTQADYTDQPIPAGWVK